MNKANSDETFNNFISLIPKFNDSSLTGDARIELETHLRMGWQDYFFIQNRCFSFDLPNHWTIEEECFLRRLNEILDGEKITPRIGILVQAIFGRTKYSVAFDPNFPQNLPTLAEEIAFNITKQQEKDIRFHPNPNENGIIYYNPSNVYRYLEDLLVMPQIVCEINKHDGSDQTPIRTTNVDEINKLLGTNMKKRPITFHCAYSLPVIIDIYPCGTDDSWYAIRTSDFKMAFGRDMSNGKGIKYPWINTINDQCPPTLSCNNHPPVDWIPASEEYLKKCDGKISEGCCENMMKFECPDFHPETYIKTSYEAFNIPPDFDAEKVSLFWFDKDTHTIPEDQIIDLIGTKKQAFIIQCSEFAECKGKCERCVVNNKGPIKDLGLFYDKNKHWGVVALKDIPAGSYVTDYAGEVVSGAIDDESLLLSFTIEIFGDITDLSIKADKRSNIGRFINQSCVLETDLFCQPNVAPFYICSLTNFLFRVGYISLRHIYAGEELNVTYGNNYEKKHKRKNEPDCCCNSCLRKRYHSLTKT